MSGIKSYLLFFLFYCLAAFPFMLFSDSVVSEYMARGWLLYMSVVVLPILSLPIAWYTKTILSTAFMSVLYLFGTYTAYIWHGYDLSVPVNYLWLLVGISIHIILAIVSLKIVNTISSYKITLLPDPSR